MSFAVVVRFAWPYYDPQKKIVSIWEISFCDLPETGLTIIRDKMLGELFIKTEAGVPIPLKQFDSACYFSLSLDVEEAFFVTSQAKLTWFVMQKENFSLGCRYVSKKAYNLSELLMCDTKKLSSEKQGYVFKKVFQNGTLMLCQNKSKSLGIWHVVGFRHIHKMAEQQRHLSLPILVETAPTDGSHFIYLSKNKNIHIFLAKRECYQASYVKPDQHPLLANIKNKHLIVSLNMFYISKKNKKGNLMADQIKRKLLKFFSLLICTRYIKRLTNNPIMAITQIIANFYMADLPVTKEDRFHFLKCLQYLQPITIEKQANNVKAVTMSTKIEKEDNAGIASECSIECYYSEKSSEDDDLDNTGHRI